MGASGRMNAYACLVLAMSARAEMKLTDNQGYKGASQTAGARAGVQPCTTAEDHVRVRVDCLRRWVGPRASTPPRNSRPGYSGQRPARWCKPRKNL